MDTNDVRQSGVNGKSRIAEHHPNEGHLLAECLQSLYANTQLPDEIWVYDDASSDPAQQYLIDFPDIKLIVGHINRGPGYARDQLIWAASSDYIQCHLII